jgi:HAD superfamily hydrolase (TIGR01509 family)
VTDGSSTSRVDLVIFDCDGVLVDSERIVVKVEAALITELGWPITEHEILERFVGRSDAHVQSVIEQNLGRKLPDWKALYERHVLDAFRSSLVPVAGIEAVLDALTIPYCVASSGTHEKMQLTLGLTGLRRRFEGRIFSTTEVANGKPAPDLFLHAASQMKVSPTRCVVVEDSKFGVAAARAAGMRVLGFAGGLTPPEWLEGPDTIVFHDMADLVSLIDQL